MNLARLSAVTDRVRLGTAVLLLPLHAAAIIATQVADWTTRQVVASPLSSPAPGCVPSQSSSRQGPPPLPSPREPAVPAPPAKSAARAAAVLTHLTGNPRGAFTLSELSKAVRVSPASLSPVLEALTDAGFLIRHLRHKTYQLGPALVAVGQAAAVRHPVVEFARDEMRTLVAETGGECIGSVVLGAEIVILAMEGRPSALTHQVAIGQRIPLAPPLGQVFLAWSPAPLVDRWLTRSFGAELSDGARRHLLDALESVRRRGYAITLSSAQAMMFSRVLREWSESLSGEDLRLRVVEAMHAVGDSYEVLHESPSEQYDDVQIIAPVFGDDGQVVFALTLLGFERLSGVEVLRAAQRLTNSAMHLTRRIGGHPPAADVVGEDVTTE